MLKIHYIHKATLFLALLFSISNKGMAQSTTEGWYTFSPANDYSKKSLIGMDDWNTEPAGKYGRIVRKGKKLIYNSREIKLWGLNNSFGFCMPSRQDAKKHAAFYRRYGINSVRLHKYADNPVSNDGIQSEHSFIGIDIAGLDRMDYYISELNKNGIFVKLSPTFHIKIGLGDTMRVPWYREIGDLTDRNRIKATFAAVYFSEGLQNMQIEQTVNVLNHFNPYTGKKYADDPGIYCVELYNEDAILWHGSAWSMQRYPTLRAQTAKKFSQFLMDKYGSEQKWKAAWGDENIYKRETDLENNKLGSIISVDHIKGLPLPAESLKAGTVVPWSYYWAYDMIVRPGNEDMNVLKIRLFDTAEFLIGLQNEFYKRFVKAIRATGYEGEIISSNWQAGSTVGHYLNLHSDARIGMIDRHNYYGGGGTNAFRKQEKFKDGSMLAIPGKGTLSTGLQQVDGRPYMLSEWIHVVPNEWYAEGPAILGAYGWGLNGWDVSYMFENGDHGEFSDSIKSRYMRWDVANPAIMANFPTIARQVRRMDVGESPETAYLNVHIPSLLEGKIDFWGETEQQHDEKTFTTNKVPAKALAATRVAVKFTDSYEETPAFNLSDYMDGNTIVSNTKELRWTPAEGDTTKGGCFTLNTTSTKGFAGFSDGKTSFNLGDGYEITPGEGFSVIYLSAKGKEETLENTSEIVVTVMARARNTGMVFNEAGNRVLDPGTSPIVLEPVEANLKVPFKGELLVLDHDGAEVKSSRRIRKKLNINGSNDQTPFYLIRK